MAVINLKTGMNMKKILFIIGSLRAKSFNRQVANVAKELIGSSAEVQELDYSDLPLLNQDIEQPEPAVVARIRKAVAEADGLWIFTPEYKDDRGQEPVRIYSEVSYEGNRPDFT